MKWNLVDEYAEGDIVDIINGPYSLANKKAREIERDTGTKIVIYESVF